jgi:probable phosphoglycerate mutase
MAGSMFNYSLLPLFTNALSANRRDGMGAKCGRFTGTTDIELTEAGVAQVSCVAASFVGTGQLLDPSRLMRIFVSPRRRSRKTFELLLPQFPEENVTFTEDIAEWDYGDYEGLNAGEIRDLRKKRGLDLEMEWDIWRDGCEGGEYVKLYISIPIANTSFKD